MQTKRILYVLYLVTNFAKPASVAQLDVCASLSQNIPFVYTFSSMISHESDLNKAPVVKLLNVCRNIYFVPDVRVVSDKIEFIR